MAHKGITDFCDICHHAVYNILKHVKTEEHLRSLRNTRQYNTHKRQEEIHGKRTPRNKRYDDK